MSSPELTKYRAGLSELLWLQPMLGVFARSMGEPVFSTSEATAWVAYDHTQRSIVFGFNPDFIMTLTDEAVAAVIAHEAHHVILDHLKEIHDDFLFPEKDVLVKAQECVINDTVEGVYELELPEFVMRGPETVGFDCSPYSSKQVYDLLKKQASEPQTKQDSAQPKSSGSEQASGGSGSSASGTADGNGGTPANEVSTADGHNHQGCGGVIVSDEDIDAYKQAFSDIISEVAADTGETVDDVLDNLQNGGSGFSLSDTQGQTNGTVSSERMNWRLLLARINPKVLDSGKPRRRQRNNWTKSNRRMASVYPKVILPVSEFKEPKKDDRGDTIPSLVIALDLSGSIPRTLVKTLQGLLNDIPKDLINAYPCTFSDNVVPYDETTKQVCRSGGTSIDAVIRYVNKIERDTKTKPYVLVITDGYFSSRYQNQIKNWFMMAVSSQYESVCGQHVPKDQVYNINDFKA